jgi:hypothetical protein
MDTSIYQKTYIRILVGTSFIITPNSQYFKCPTILEEMKCGTPEMECCKALKKNRLLKCVRNGPIPQKTDMY